MALIPPDAGIGMRLQANADGLRPLAPVTEIPIDLPDLRTGQMFTARIQEVLPENVYKALVAGKQITLQLPGGATAGDTLELVVIDRTPKAVVAKLAEPAAGPGAAGNLYTTLSRPAQLIGNLLLQDGTPPQPAALNRGEPLLPQPPASAADLVPALQKAVAQSGLFYESHQAQWATGRLPIERILQEPQGQLSAPATLAQHGLPPHAATAAADAGRAVAAENPSLLQTLFGARPAEEAASPAPLPASAPGVPEELRPLVQQQLDAVATQRLLWHGEAWPNQRIDWEIIREDDHGNAPDAEQDASWRTTLKLETPRLGSIAATLRLTAGGIHLALSTPSDAAATDLRNGIPTLATALDAAGIPLLSFQVKHGQEE
ncbi:MAG: flagellar hook-length control protein FliK [Rhodocyclales bacterium]|nr:flagellar hook-length control protein FliK [Rhodocyclales bacterium]